MNFEFAADLIRAFHAFWILFLFLSCWLAFRAVTWKKKWLIFLPFVVSSTTILSNILWYGCPLTMLETWLRRKGDPSFIYEQNSFVIHVSHQWLGIQISPGIVVLIMMATFGGACLIAYRMNKIVSLDTLKETS